MTAPAHECGSPGCQALVGHAAVLAAALLA